MKSIFILTSGKNRNLNALSDGVVEKQVQYVIEPTRSKLFDWKELWSYRELFYFFSWRDVKVKYKQTMLGVLWVVLQPIVTVIIFTIFFGRTLPAEHQQIPYPVFVLSGLVLWNFFSSAVNASSASMLSNAPIIKKIYFPRIIIPVASVIVASIDFVIAFVLFIAVTLYYQVVPNLSFLVFWPLAILMALIGTIGISCFLAALTVKYRDFRFVIPFGLQIALFVSPIIYPLSIIKSSFVVYILALNPMYGAISLFRIPLMNEPVNITTIFISIAATLVLFVVGIVYFKKTENYFADIA
jgi:lipopolysaccharide transport system permease protein